MGVIVLNNEADTSPHAQRWGLLAFTCVLGAWCTIPRERGPRRNIWIGLKALGVIGLVVALAIFRRTGPAEFPIVGRVEDWGLAPIRMVGNPGPDRLGLPRGRTHYARPGPSAGMADGGTGPLDGHPPGGYTITAACFLVSRRKPG